EWRNGSRWQGRRRARRNRWRWRNRRHRGSRSRLSCREHDHPLNSNARMPDHCGKKHGACHILGEIAGSNKDVDGVAVPARVHMVRYWHFCAPACRESWYAMPDGDYAEVTTTAAPVGSVPDLYHPTDEAHAEHRDRLLRLVTVHYDHGVPSVVD